MQDPEYFIRLLKGHLEDTLTPEEREGFMDALRSGAFRDLLGDDIPARLKTPPLPDHSLSSETQQRIIDRILHSESAGAPVVSLSRRKRWPWVAAAASLLTLASLTFLYRTHTSHSSGIDSHSLVAGNNSDSVLNINLEDGSTIGLQP